jgi:hypothetical protein
MPSLVYVFPMTALVSLFVHVLRYPEKASAKADIQFMDMVAGHLGYLEYATTNLEFPIAKEMTNLARRTVAMGKSASVEDRGSNSRVQGQQHSQVSAVNELVDVDAPFFGNDVRRDP